MYENFQEHLQSYFKQQVLQNIEELISLYNINRFLENQQWTYCLLYTSPVRQKYNWSTV